MNTRTGDPRDLQSYTDLDEETRREIGIGFLFGELTTEESLESTQEFVRELMGLKKREFGKLQREVSEEQKDAYEQRLIERISGQVEALIEKGVRVDIKEGQLYGFSSDLFGQSIFTSPTTGVDVPSGKLANKGDLNKRINGKIAERFPIRNVLYDVKSIVPAKFRKGGGAKNSFGLLSLKGLKASIRRLKPSK